MLRRTGPLTPTAMYQQGVRRNQQDFKEYKEVKRISGEKRPVQSHQLEQKQWVKESTCFIVAATRIKMSTQRQNGCHHQHKGGKRIGQ